MIHRGRARGTISASAINPRGKKTCVNRNFAACHGEAPATRRHAACARTFTGRPPARLGQTLSRRRAWDGPQVVARSPDLATWPTEGLQPRARRETYGPAGPP